MTTDTATAVISVLSFIAMKDTGRLIGLADVEIVIDGVILVIHGVQVKADGAGTEVRLPKYRAPNGEWVTAITLPDEVRGPMGDAVIAAGLEAGVLKDRGP